jgi:hypothetical protein
VPSTRCPRKRNVNREVAEPELRQRVMEDLTELVAARHFEEYQVFVDEIRNSGHDDSGNGLKPAATAATVRVRSGKPSMTDGPSVETKEHVGGYAVIEARAPGIS